MKIESKLDAFNFMLAFRNHFKYKFGVYMFDIKIPTGESFFEYNLILNVSGKWFINQTFNDLMQIINDRNLYSNEMIKGATKKQVVDYIYKYRREFNKELEREISYETN